MPSLVPGKLSLVMSITNPHFLKKLSRPGCSKQVKVLTWRKILSWHYCLEYNTNSSWLVTDIDFKCQVSENHVLNNPALVDDFWWIPPLPKYVCAATFERGLRISSWVPGT
jgi:hypothetical protein